MSFIGDNTYRALRTQKKKKRIKKMRRNFNEGTGYQNALRDRKISLESEQPEEILKVNINQY